MCTIGFTYYICWSEGRLTQAVELCIEGLLNSVRFINSVSIWHSWSSMKDVCPTYHVRENMDRPAGWQIYKSCICRRGHLSSRERYRNWETTIELSMSFQSWASKTADLRWTNVSLMAELQKHPSSSIFYEASMCQDRNIVRYSFKKGIASRILQGKLDYDPNFNEEPFIALQPLKDEWTSAGYWASQSV